MTISLFFNDNLIKPYLTSAKPTNDNLTKVLNDKFSKSLNDVTEGNK